MVFDFSELIDARLVGVTHKLSVNDIILAFSKRSGLVEIRALSVERILISDFTEQNVVDEITIHAGREERTILKERIAELLFRCSAADAMSKPTFSEKLNATLREVEAGEKVFLEVIPVVGASVSLLALKLEILDIQGSIVP